jgi:hypothetical protein
MEYQPFQDEANEIRLITILPIEGEATQSSQIRCRLEVVSFDEKFRSPAYKLYRSNTYPLAPGRIVTQDTLEDWVEVLAPLDDATTNLPEFRYTWGDYMALSYTWGDPSKIREILVNGHVMRVTENLEACLRVLRDKPYMQNGWKIWIDALCINQADIVERAFQVKRMHDIYRKAWTPLIWLGNEEESSDGAMTLIKLLAHTFTMNDQVNALTQALHRDPSQFGEGNWRALHQLINRRYWSRMWILQEAAMGRKDTPVLCGQQTLPWIDVSRTFWLLNKTDEVLNKFMKNELEEKGLEFSISTWSTLSTVSELQVLQDAENGHKPGNLYRLLHLGRTVFASDPRDKVYGILNLMGQDLASLIKPDYTANLLEVYTDFAWNTILATGLLDVIRHRYPTKEESFPSWVPDWTVEPSTSPLNYSNTNFAASGSSKSEIQGPRKGNLLPCKGFKVDTFDGMGCIWSESWDPETVVQTDGSANPYGSFEDIQNAIWKTLVASRNIDGEPLLEDYSFLLATPALADAQIAADDPLSELINSNIFTWCVKFLRNNSKLRVCGRPLHEYFSAVAESSAIDPVLLRDGLMQRDHITVRRRFITTAKGYTGMSLENIRKGDGIYILLGCTVPVVLRPSQKEPGHFEFLGECYIQGIMEGEAFEGAERTEGLIQDIVLC